MKLIEAFKLACKELSSEKVSFTEDEVRTLLSHAINRDKSYVFINGQQELEKPQQELFQSYIEKRKQHCPTAYIIGRAGFYNSDFFVNEDVLIPRPETEMLVERVLKEIKEIEEPKVIDFGTGSGCIALSLLKERVDARALLVDISVKAIEVANQNVNRLGLCSQAELLTSKVEDLEFKKIRELGFENVDLVVANPPYIAKESTELEYSVKKYEPTTALFAGEKGWENYQVWANKALELLRPGALFACEIGYDQKGALNDIFARQSQWEEINFYKDLSGRDRMLILRKRGATDG